MGAMKGKVSRAEDNDLKLGTTPSHGSPPSNNPLNTELNNVARNTDDTARARKLVAAGADLSSTNGPAWRHTPLHQAAFHGRYEMARTLVELGAPLELHSNPCGRGASGTPLELARGGGHHRIAEMLEAASQSKLTPGDRVLLPNSVAEDNEDKPVMECNENNPVQPSLSKSSSSHVHKSGWRSLRARVVFFFRRETRATSRVKCI